MKKAYYCYYYSTYQSCAQLSHVFLFLIFIGSCLDIVTRKPCSVKSENYYILLSVVTKYIGKWHWVCWIILAGLVGTKMSIEAVKDLKDITSGSYNSLVTCTLSWAVPRYNKECMYWILYYTALYQPPHCNTLVICTVSVAML